MTPEIQKLVEPLSPEKHAVGITDGKYAVESGGEWNDVVKNKNCKKNLVAVNLEFCLNIKVSVFTRLKVPYVMLLWSENKKSMV